MLSAVAPGRRAAAMIFASRFIKTVEGRRQSFAHMRTPNSAVRPFERLVRCLGRDGTTLSYAGDGI
jgi:hypothetical protein